MLARWLNFPVAASTLAGLLGAGITDLALVLARGQGVPLVDTAALTLGLYGAAGLVLAALAGWAVAVIAGSMRDAGPRPEKPELDTRFAAALLLAALGAACWAPCAPLRTCSSWPRCTAGRWPPSRPSA